MASGVPKKSTCTEWSTTRSTGTSGSMIFGFLPRRADRRAHGRQIDQQRHAGKILQAQCARQRTEFPPCVRRLASSWPARATFASVDPFAVAIAQHGFQHQPNGDRQFGDGANAGFFQLRQGIKSALLSRCRVRSVEVSLKRLCASFIKSGRKYPRRAENSGVRGPQRQELQCRLPMGCTFTRDCYPGRWSNPETYQ